MDVSNKPYGFFRDTNGNKSSARLIAFILIIAQLAFAQQFIIFAMIQNLNILLVATSVATTVTTIGGSAMFYLFNKQSTEMQDK